MSLKYSVSLFAALLFGFATPSYSGDIISCDSFESCPSGLPTDINPVYLNTIVKDASGRILGSGVGDKIINEKGYVLNVIRTGSLTSLSLVYGTSDCTGPGYSSGYHYGGYVFSTTNINGDFDVRYTKKSVGQVYLAQTYQIANPGTISGSCVVGNTYGNFFPAFFNDPETTGVPNGIGSAANPYPIPLSHHRYGSN